jgi:hypothetical protein
MIRLWSRKTETQHKGSRGFLEVKTKVGGDNRQRLEDKATTHICFPFLTYCKILLKSNDMTCVEFYH